MGYPLLGTRETWVVPTVPLATVFPSHAPRSTLPPPLSTPHAVTSGVRSCKTLPRWLLPDYRPPNCQGYYEAQLRRLVPLF